MKVLVTGGAGYIGSHAVRALLAGGHEVVVLDNLCKGHRKAIPAEVPFYQVDLAQTAEIAGILSRHTIDVVMHFAAFIAVEESVTDPVKYYRNNTGGALSLLAAMQEAKVQRFIFSSTAATYGMPETVPILEDFPQKPINPYGWSKWMVERILLDVAEADADFGFTALRYFNVAGAAADGTIGEDHLPETHILPRILFVPLGKAEQIKIFGTDYPTEDGTCIRDYVHVEDLISAHILAMEALEPGDKKFYNLAIGRGYSVKEMIDAAEKVVGQEIKKSIEPRRSGDPPLLYASSEKIQKELGWKPHYVAVEDVIASAWNWHKNHPNGYGD